MQEILGYIALVLYGAALLFESPRKSFWCSNLGNVFFVAQCFVSSMYVAAFGPVCLTLLTLFVLKTERKNWQLFVMAYAITFATIGAILAGQNSAELFAVFGSFFSAASRLGRDQFYLYRGISSLGNICWLSSAWIMDIQSFMLMSSMLLVMNMSMTAKHAYKYGHFRLWSRVAQANAA